MFVVTRFRVDPVVRAEVAGHGAALLAVLETLPGFRSGELGAAADDEGLLALLTTWDGVGAYRRALGQAQVKIVGAPLWVHAVDEPGVYVSGE